VAGIDSSGQSDGPGGAGSGESDGRDIEVSRMETSARWCIGPAKLSIPACHETLHAISADTIIQR